MSRTIADIKPAIEYAASRRYAGAQMNGNVIGFDPVANTGAISGHDGRRYDFATVDWHGNRRPQHGDLVDFTPEGEHAAQIYLVEEAYVVPTIGAFLLSPTGRISRSQYWLHWVLPTFAKCSGQASSF